jgi:anti-sigma regulatory factor (Ser/Thr protein kinase)
MHQRRQAAFRQAQDRRNGDQVLGPPALDLPAADRHCSIALAATPGSAKAARDFTRAAMRGWQLDLLTDDAVIVASELATNAIRHGSTLAADGTEAAQVGLTWWSQASRLVCVVTDRSSKPPVLELADLDAESGHGLQIVHALAAGWGWTMLGAGAKAVWATLQLPGVRSCPAGEPLLRLAAGRDRLPGRYSSNRARQASCRASR